MKTKFINPTELDLEHITDIQAGFLKQSLKPKKPARKKNRKLEDNVQTLVIGYLRKTYPDVLYKADFSTGMIMSIGQAVKAKKLGGNVKNFPDLNIIEPKAEYHGLFLELKNKTVKIYKEDGDYYKNDHHIEQSKMMQKIESKGYLCSFAIGEYHAKDLIDSYLSSNIEKFKKIRII